MVTTYKDLCQLWYASLRQQGLSHRQICVLDEGLSGPEMDGLKETYEGNEIKHDLGDER